MIELLKILGEEIRPILHVIFGIAGVLSVLALFGCLGTAELAQGAADFSKALSQALGFATAAAVFGALFFILE